MEKVMEFPKIKRVRTLSVGLEIIWRSKKDDKITLSDPNVSESGITADRKRGCQY